MRTKEAWETYADAEMLRGVTVRLIRPEEQERWDALMAEQHYLGNARLVGRQRRYVAEWRGAWIALAGWSAPAYHLKDREAWIGWGIEQRLKRLKFVAQNSRFLLLVPRGQYPNLASRVLGLCQRRLPDDWREAYGYPVLLAETFTDPQRFSGGCYRATGWEKLGQTQGFRRVRQDFYQEDSSPKELWVKPLHPQARRWLQAEQMPEGLARHEDPAQHCPYGTPDMHSLWDHYARLKEPRTAKGLRHPLPSVLGIATIATICGARGPAAMAEFASHLSQPQLRALRTHRNRQTGLFEAPSEGTFRRVLSRVDAEALDQQVIAWMKARDPSRLRQLAVDGKTVKGSRRADGKPVHLVSGVSIEHARLCAQRPVEEKSNEITAFEPMLERVDLNGVIVSADAMQTQQPHARYTVQEKGGDYFFALKENQPGILEKARGLLAGAFPPWGGPSGRTECQGARPV